MLLVVYENHKVRYVKSKIAWYSVLVWHSIVSYDTDYQLCHVAFITKKIQVSLAVLLWLVVDRTLILGGLLFLFVVFECHHPL